MPAYVGSKNLKDLKAKGPHSCGYGVICPSGAAILCDGWRDVVLREAWAFRRTSSRFIVRLHIWLEFKKPQGGKSTANPSALRAGSLRSLTAIRREAGFFLRILSAEGRGVRLSFELSKPKGLKGYCTYCRAPIGFVLVQNLNRTSRGIYKAAWKRKKKIPRRKAGLLTSRIFLQRTPEPSKEAIQP